MTPEELRRLLTKVAAKAAKVGELPDEAEAGPPAGPIFRPADPRVAGVVADWVTPVASRWAPQLDLEPRELATVLAEGLTQRRRVSAVEVAPSGLLALTLSDSARAQIIPTVLEEADTYGLRPGQALTLPVDEGVGSRPPDDPIACAQLAHARLCRLIRNAQAAGVEMRKRDRLEELTHVSERLLLVALADHPQRMARHEGDDQQLVRAVTDLAALANGWTHPIRPELVDEHPTSIHGARLALATATRIVLRNGLAHLGIPAPERM
jgi:arginyl-tRNA synthetase